jgi:hypothetical protein
MPPRQLRTVPLVSEATITARIRLLCHRHDIFVAERNYGKQLMEKYRHQGGRVSETSPVYGYRAGSFTMM